MEEIWKDIEGYEGSYQVSNMGHVRSLDRYIDNGRGSKAFRKGHDLVNSDNTDGYPSVNLNRDGHSKTITVHLLVAKAFLCHPDDDYKYEVNHIDCNKHNNCVDNLEYCTHLENMQHAVRMGVHGCLRDLTGPNNPNYGNTALRDRCRANPEWSFENHSQPGAKNGNARRVEAEINGEVHTFSYIGECADYLIEQGIASGYRPTIRDYISRSARNNVPYWGIQFKYI